VRVYKNFLTVGKFILIGTTTSWANLEEDTM
jgi:hypothetical protein